MDTLPKLWELLVITCGYPCLITMIGLSAVTLGGSLFLIYSRKRLLLNDFQPLTWLPLYVGGFRSFLALATAVNLMRASGDSAENTLLLAMSLIPAFLGFSLSLPGALASVAGKASITWKATLPLVADPTRNETDALDLPRKRDSVVQDRSYDRLLRSRD